VLEDVDAALDDEDAGGKSESLVREIEDVDAAADDVVDDDAVADLDGVADDDAIAEGEDATAGVTSGGGTEFCPSPVCIVSTMSSG
jgi:hypothetical protein